MMERRDQSVRSQPATASTLVASQSRSRDGLRTRGSIKKARAKLIGREVTKSHVSEELGTWIADIAGFGAI